MICCQRALYWRVGQWAWVANSPVSRGKSRVLLARLQSLRTQSRHPCRNQRRVIGGGLKSRLSSAGHFATHERSSRPVADLSSPCPPRPCLAIASGQRLECGQLWAWAMFGRGRRDGGRGTGSGAGQTTALSRPVSGQECPCRASAARCPPRVSAHRHTLINAVKAAQAQAGVRCSARRKQT